MFEGFDLNDLWDESEYSTENYVSDPPTDELIAEIEHELGYKLPASYIWLMKKHNGGLLSKDACPCDEPTSWADDHVGVTGIMGIGRKKENSLCGEMGTAFWIDEWDYPDIGIAIADCPSAGHDMIFLDYRECGRNGEPAVVHIDGEDDNKITKLADNFESFIRLLCYEADYE